MDGISVALAQLSTDRFQHAENIADRAILIFHAHVDDTAVIGDTVKGGVNLDASFAELLPDVPGEHYIGTTLFRQFANDRIVFVLFAHSYAPLNLFPIGGFAPPGNVGNQFQRQADRALAAGKCRQSVSKGRHRLGTGIQPDMLLGCRELDQVATLPEGGHAPRNYLLCFGDRRMDGFLKLPQNRLHFFRLPQDIFLDGLRGFSAVMALIPVILSHPPASGKTFLCL